MLRRVFSLAWLLVAIILIGVAGLLSVARTWLPQFGAQRAEVQRWVSQAVGQPVQIDALDAEWRGLYPVLHLRGVRLLDPKTHHTLLHFTELRVAVDPYAALYRWRVQVHALSVIGARLSVERRSDGSFAVLGFGEMPNNKADSAAVLGWFATQPELSLLRSEIHWRDALAAAPLLFTAVDIKLENDGTRHKLVVVTRLPQSLGSKLRCVLDFAGDFAAPAQWSGGFYLHGTDMQLAAWLRGRAYAGMTLADGTADVELWGALQDLRLQALTGSVRMRKLRLAGATAPALSRLSGRLRFKRDARSWRIDVEDLHLARGAQEWPVSGFSLRQRTLADNSQRIYDAGFDFLRLRDVSDLAQLGSVLPASTQAMLAGLAVTGDMRDLRAQLQFHDDTLQHYYLAARLLALTAHAWQNIPALSGVTGMIEGTDSEGRLRLDSHPFSIDLPKLFRQPLQLRDLSGDIEWRHYPALLRIQAARLVADNPDLHTETRFSLDLPQVGKPFLDMQTDFADGAIAAVPRYLPAHIMSPGVVAWLDRAFLGGRVRDGVALFHGRPADFPFDAQNGVFQVSVDVENVGLEYGAAWPRIDGIAAQVNFTDRSMVINADRGNIFAAQLGATRVSIMNLQHGELQIDGGAQADNADLLRFLRESPLSAHYPDTLTGLTARGASHLTLSLSLPLASPQNLPLLLGRIDFSAGTLSLPGFDQGLDDISGPLDFTNTGLFSTGLRASLSGQPVMITAQTQEHGPNAGTRLDLQGRVDIKTLAARLPSAFWRLLEGGSDYQASLLFAPHGAAPVLHIESALRGVTVRLPAPLAKTGKETRQFSMDMPLDNTGHGVITADYGDTLRGAFEINRAAGKIVLSRGELRSGGAPAQLPETAGLRIAGELDQFDFDAWRAALPLGKSTDIGLNAADNIDALDIHVQEFKAGSYTLHGLHLVAERQPVQWQVNIESDALRGRIQVPLTYPQDRPVVMTLDYLHLNADKPDSATGKPIDPRQLPALQLTAKQFEYQGADFGTLTLNTTRNAAGMHVDKALVVSPALTASASGDWLVDNAAQSSSFSIDLTAPQLGVLLSKFGYIGNIKGGETVAKIQADWPGSPARFALERLQGTLHVKIRNGRFVDIGTGAGRVFGLLSLNELQRRLRLDFSDLFKKGFTFDEISGDFSLRDGNAVTDNTVIKGPAARIAIAGRTGLASRDYEQLITVTPHLTSSLPLAGAIANPGIGAALFLAQKLFGSQIEAITSYQYTVHGSWDKPVIERVYK